VALLMMIGCSGAGTVTNESAGEFVLRELGYAFTGQSSREYAGLIAAQRAVVTKMQFEEYVRTDVYPARAIAKVVETYPDATDIPGTSLRRLRATAVRVNITGGGQVVTESMHAYLVGGKWYWAMTSDAVDEALGRLPACSGAASCRRFVAEAFVTHTADGRCMWASTSLNLARNGTNPADAARSCQGRARM
jgi:hypothetical protein